MGTLTQHDEEFLEYAVPRFATSTRKRVREWYLAVNLESDVQVYTFSFGRLAAQAAGYAFLLSLAKTVVIMIAMYILPEKQAYTDLMLELSKDFHPESELTRELSEA